MSFISFATSMNTHQIDLEAAKCLATLSGEAKPEIPHLGIIGEETAERLIGLLDYAAQMISEEDNLSPFNLPSLKHKFWLYDDAIRDLQSLFGKPTTGASKWDEMFRYMDTAQVEDVPIVIRHTLTLE